MPSNLALAATWDLELARRQGEAVGAEARTPRASTSCWRRRESHRDPRGGRDFEYFSEDPLLDRPDGRRRDRRRAKPTASSRPSSTTRSTTRRPTGRSSMSGSTARRPASPISSPSRSRSSAGARARHVRLQSSERNLRLRERLAAEPSAQGRLALSRASSCPTGARFTPPFVRRWLGSIRNRPYRPTENLFRRPPPGDRPARFRRLGSTTWRTNPDIDLRLRAGRCEHAASPISPRPMRPRGRSSARARSSCETRACCPLPPKPRSLVIGAHADRGVSGGGSSQVVPRGGMRVQTPEGDGAMIYDPSSPIDAMRSSLPSTDVNFDDGIDPAGAAKPRPRARRRRVRAPVDRSADASLTLPDDQDLIVDVATANPRTIVVLETGGPVFMPWLDTAARCSKPGIPAAGRRGDRRDAVRRRQPLRPVAGHLPAANLSQLPRPKNSMARASRRTRPST